MNIKEYSVNLHLKSGFIIDMNVKGESAEDVLNYVQGLLHVREGWIHLNDALDNKHRVKPEEVIHLAVIADNIV